MPGLSPHTAFTLERIDGDIDFRPLPVADRLADEQIIAFVLFAFTDDDAAGNRDAVEFLLHGEHGRVVGGLLIALAAPFASSNSSALGDADEFQRQSAMQIGSTLGAVGFD